MAAVTVVSFFPSSVLQASRNWLREPFSFNYVNDSALFPDSWDGKGARGREIPVQVPRPSPLHTGSKFTHFVSDFHVATSS